MSADNYGICPRCRKHRKERIEKLKYEQKAGYGNLTQEAWSLLSKRTRALEYETNIRSLDERWEIHLSGEIDPPEFYVSYGCRCDVCGYEFSFQHKEIINFESEDDSDSPREWSKEWPNSPGYYWFYGWAYRYEEAKPPAMCYVRMSAVGHVFALSRRGGILYVIHENQAHGLWLSVSKPYPPDGTLLMELIEELQNN